MKKALQKEIERLGGQFDLSKIFQYLKDREKEEGGFSFIQKIICKPSERRFQSC